MMKSLQALALMMSVNTQPIWVEDKHPFPAGKSNLKCNEAPFLSYHIHVMLWPKNKIQVDAALDFQKKFNNHFTEDGKMPICDFKTGDPQPDRKTLCLWETSYEAVGPWLTGQYAWHVPKDLYEVTTAWSKQNRDDLDVMIHPNTGCEVEDHTEYATWAGKPWQIDPSIFSCEYPGCT